MSKPPLSDSCELAAGTAARPRRGIADADCANWCAAYQRFSKLQTCDFIRATTVLLLLMQTACSVLADMMDNVSTCLQANAALIRQLPAGALERKAAPTREPARRDAKTANAKRRHEDTPSSPRTDEKTKRKKEQAEVNGTDDANVEEQERNEREERCEASEVQEEPAAAENDDNDDAEEQASHVASLPNVDDADDADADLGNPLLCVEM